MLLHNSPICRLLWAVQSSLDSKVEHMVGHVWGTWSPGSGHSHTDHYQPFHIILPWKLSKDCASSHTYTAISLIVASSRVEGEYGTCLYSCSTILQKATYHMTTFKTRIRGVTLPCRLGGIPKEPLLFNSGHYRELVVDPCVFLFVIWQEPGQAGVHASDWSHVYLYPCMQLPAYMQMC